MSCSGDCDTLWKYRSDRADSTHTLLPCTCSKPSISTPAGQSPLDHNNSHQIPKPNALACTQTPHCPAHSPGTILTTLPGSVISVRKFNSHGIKIHIHLPHEEEGGAWRSNDSNINTDINISLHWNQFSHSEDGGGMLLWNVGHLTTTTCRHQKEQQFFINSTVFRDMKIDNKYTDKLLSLSSALGSVTSIPKTPYQPTRGAPSTSKQPITQICGATWHERVTLQK